jgi:gag-polypeptide of LTR copia-type
MPDDPNNASFEKLTHSNYHSWVLHASGKLKKAKVWHVVTGDEPKPLLLVQLDASATPVQQAQYAIEKKNIHEWELNDDVASGILMELIAPDQERHIEDYTSAKDFWDRLKVVYQSAHAGIAAFYMKVGMMKWEYVEGESMQAHIDFLLGEKRSSQPQSRHLMMSLWHS